MITQKCKICDKPQKTLKHTVLCGCGVRIQRKK